MVNQYDSNEVEKEICRFWEDKKTFKFDFEREGEIFSIDTPPPTVSGAMHIGHSFSYSQQDFIARFRRMKGNVFYPFGTDDNGLPTERLIERVKNVKSKDMARSEFIDLCLKTLKEITPEFVNDWKKLGVSCDYDITYSTIDDASRKIAQKSFIDLYHEGRAYKKEFPTLWCPECSTGIAQAELEDKEEESLFSTLKFKVDDKELLIATTRPELLGACVAVFVNPRDKRYKKFVSKKAKVPLFGHEVPIIEDESAEIDKGTGVLMICSYGDRFDVDAINRHGLEAKIILNKNGEILDGKYKGMYVKKARKQILEDLKNDDLIVEQKEIKHVVNTHDKCGTAIEFLTTEQWFIKILDKKTELNNQGKNIKWYPTYMQKRYENWVNGLEWDWSISRDRHFGPSIPVWFCKNCSETIVAEESELPVDPIQSSKKCPKCKTIAEPETKVFDTWMTSSLTPQIASSLVDHKVKPPYSLRPQAHDIIRTWAFYTITKSLYHDGVLPWENIMVSGFVTLGKEKMSKSKGNVIKPQDVADKYGADSLRYWAAGSKLGEDLAYQEKDIVTGKKLLTKLWNATNFVFMNLEDYDHKEPLKLEKLDEIFLVRLNNVVKVATESFENYEYSKVRSEVERFFWNDFCDNYLEIVKKRIYNDLPGKISAQYTLYKSLYTVLKMLSPIVPFITEKIYQDHFKTIEGEESIHLSRWPEIDDGLIGKDDVDPFGHFVDILVMVRQEKTVKKKSMKSEIKLTLGQDDLDKLGPMVEDLKNVTNAVIISAGKFEVEFVD